MAGLNSLKSLSETCVQMMVSELPIRDAIKLEAGHLILISQSEDSAPCPTGRGHTAQLQAALEPKRRILQVTTAAAFEPRRESCTLTRRDKGWWRWKPLGGCCYSRGLAHESHKKAVKLELLPAVLHSRILSMLCMKEGWPGKTVFGFKKKQKTCP